MVLYSDRRAFHLKNLLDQSRVNQTTMAENPYKGSTTSLRREINASESDSGFKLASRTRRIFARLIDVLLVLLNCMWLTYVLAPTFWGRYYQSAEDEEINWTDSRTWLGFWELDDWFFLISVAATTFLLQAYFLYKYGQTLGKRMLRIMVVDITTQQKPNLVRLFLLRECGILLFGNALLLIFVDIVFICRPNRRCLHDYWSRTKVVHIG